MLVEEVQHSLVSTLILLAHLRVLQVRASRHPAVDLGREGLNVVGDLQVSLEGRDIIGRLVLRGESREGNVDVLGVVGVDHGRVALHGRLEELVVAAGGQRGDLAAPAEAQDRPLEALAGGQLVALGDDVGELGEGVRRGGLGLEELAELLLVLVGRRRVPGDIGGAALEEVGHEDPVLLLVGGG